MFTLPTYTPGTSRHFDFRLGFGIPIVLAGLLFLLDLTEFDLSITRLFYSPEDGFIGRHSFWLENILHNRAKQLLILLASLTAVGFLLSVLFKKYRPWCRPLGYLLLAITLSTSIVTPLKKLTAMHCPWSLSEFGGTEIHTPLLSKRAPTLNPGRCWPGGHASAGFSLIALYFALRDKRPRAARIALAIALGLGAIFSIGRMMQGAHFLSHNLWTLFFDWIICLMCYHWLLYQPPSPTAERSDRTASPHLVRAS